MEEGGEGGEAEEEIEVSFEVGGIMRSGRKGMGDADQCFRQSGQGGWRGKGRGVRARMGEGQAKGPGPGKLEKLRGMEGGSPGGCGSPSKIPDPTWLKDIREDFSEMFGQKNKRSVTAEEKEKGSRWGNRICKGQAVRKSWETCS